MSEESRGVDALHHGHPLPDVAGPTSRSSIRWFRSISVAGRRPWVVAVPTTRQPKIPKPVPDVEPDVPSQPLPDEQLYGRTTKTTAKGAPKHARRLLPPTCPAMRTSMPHSRTPRRASSPPHDAVHASARRDPAVGPGAPPSPTSSPSPACTCPDDGGHTPALSRTASAT